MFELRDICIFIKNLFFLRNEIIFTFIIFQIRVLRLVFQISRSVRTFLFDNFKTAQMRPGRVEVGHHGVIKPLNQLQFHGIVLRVSVTSMEPTSFHLKAKPKWNGFIISWTGIKVQVRDHQTGLRRTE